VTTDTAVAEVEPIERVAVLGFGAMGSGIAQVCAAAGCEVSVLETDQKRLDIGFERIDLFLDRSIQLGKLSLARSKEIRDAIHGATSPGDLAGSELIIEAVFEDLNVKNAVFDVVAPVVGEDVVIATNTSALSVTGIAALVPNSARVAGFHFFNPVQLMNLVEIIPAETSAPETVATLGRFAEQIGKSAVITKDRPGFLVNRILLPYINQALQAYDDGIATGEDIDRAVELGLGYPMGPLRLADMIGLDVHYHATDAAYRQLQQYPFAPPPVLARLVEAGRYGRKTGRGIYDYAEEPLS